MCWQASLQVKGFEPVEHQISGTSENRSGTFDFLDETYFDDSAVKGRLTPVRGEAVTLMPGPLT
jgi:hypothetical protein